MLLWSILTDSSKFWTFSYNVLRGLNSEVWMYDWSDNNFFYLQRQEDPQRDRGADSPLAAHGPSSLCSYSLWHQTVLLCGHRSLWGENFVFSFTETDLKPPVRYLFPINCRRASIIWIFKTLLFYLGYNTLFIVIIVIRVFLVALSFCIKKRKGTESSKA